MQEKTIIIQGYFGDKEETESAYVKRWTDHCCDFYRLVPTAPVAEVNALRDKVSAWAREEFWRMYRIQNPAV